MDVFQKEVRFMMHHGYAECGCRRGDIRHGRWLTSVDDELRWLRRHQRDLEEELADVVERIRRLEKAGHPEEA
jgi:hypothetical protein